MDITPLDRWLDGYERDFDIVVHLDDPSTDEMFFRWASDHASVVVIENGREQASGAKVINFDLGEDDDVTANEVMRVATTSALEQMLESSAEQNTGA